MSASIFTVNTKAYPDTDPAWLQEACGILPMWVAQYDMMSKVGAYDGSLVDYMTEAYGFGDLFEIGIVIHLPSLQKKSDAPTRCVAAIYSFRNCLAPTSTLSKSRRRRARLRSISTDSALSSAILESASSHAALSTGWCWM